MVSCPGLYHTIKEECDITFLYILQIKRRTICNIIQQNISCGYIKHSRFYERIIYCGNDEMLYTGWQFHLKTFLDDDQSGPKHVARFLTFKTKLD